MPRGVGDPVAKRGPGPRCLRLTSLAKLGRKPWAGERGTEAEELVRDKFVGKPVPRTFFKSNF